MAQTTGTHYPGHFSLEEFIALVDASDNYSDAGFHDNARCYGFTEKDGADEQYLQPSRIV